MLKTHNMKKSSVNDACIGNSKMDYKRKISKHPCYDPKAQHKYGRIHLAVAPKCNVQCNFCVRKFDCVNESRPGITSKVLTPLEAFEHTKKIISKNPFIKVVGIAGPGDPLANKETFETLELIKNEFPDVSLCLSTNGLLLYDNIPELVRLGVSILTVTVNGVDPKIIEKIYSFANYKGKIFRGIDAANIIHENQMKGIKAAVEEGMVIKINTVLIPTINDHHIVDIAKKVHELGVYIMNVMPLINQGKFSHLTPPTDEARAKTQNDCKPFVKQMKHCRQCRSDAYGLIGKDLSQLTVIRKESMNESNS